MIRLLHQIQSAFRKPAPAERFRVTSGKGTSEVGKLADLVLVDGDPEQDVMALTRVRFTIRKGRVIYAKAP